MSNQNGVTIQGDFAEFSEIRRAVTKEKPRFKNMGAVGAATVFLSDVALALLDYIEAQQPSAAKERAAFEAGARWERDYGNGNDDGPIAIAARRYPDAAGGQIQQSKTMTPGQICDIISPLISIKYVPFGSGDAPVVSGVGEAAKAISAAIGQPQREYHLLERDDGSKCVYYTVAGDPAQYVVLDTLDTKPEAQANVGLPVRVCDNCGCRYTNPATENRDGLTVLVCPKCGGQWCTSEEADND